MKIAKHSPPIVKTKWEEVPAVYSECPHCGHKRYDIYPRGDAKSAGACERGPHHDDCVCGGVVHPALPAIKGEPMRVRDTKKFFAGIMKTEYYVECDVRRCKARTPLAPTKQEARVIAIRCGFKQLPTTVRSYNGPIYLRRTVCRECYMRENNERMESGHVKI